MRRTYLVLLAVLIVACRAESTPTIAPPPTRDVAATVVASHWMTATAEAASVPTATLTATPTPTVTVTPTPLPPPRLEGQVVDAASDEPLVGAQVAANERETATDSDGRFLFTDLAPGQYTVLVTSTDHDPILSGIVDLRAGEQVVLDAALPAAGTGDYPRDPMASNQVDPAGAPTAQEAERLARLQGLQGEVVSIREVVLEGEYLVNYRKGDAIRSAMATLHHPAWELVDEAGQAWYIIRVCGNLAVVRAPQIEVPAQCVAQPHPVVSVGSQAVNAHTCPAESCSVAVELPAGWHGVALECAPGCGWLRVQYPGIDGSCWVRRDWLQTWGELAELPVVPVAVSGQIAFISDRDSPDYGEIYLMNPDGSEQVRLTSDLRLRAVQGGGCDWALNFRWSGESRQFYLHSGGGGRLYRVNADGSGAALVTDRILGFDLSPDGRRLVANISAPSAMQSEVVIMTTDGVVQSTLTSDSVRAALGLEQLSSLHGAAWSRDGQRIAFYSSDKICAVNADGTAPVVLVSETYDAAGFHLDWSPDGTRILVTGPQHINVLKVATGEMDQLVADGIHPSWAPDGEWVVLARPFGGKEGQIWIVRADGTGLTQLTTEGKNCCPVWLP